MRSSFLRNLSLGILGLTLAASPVFAKKGGPTPQAKENFRTGQRTLKATMLWENVLNKQSQLLKLQGKQSQEWKTLATAMGGVRADINTMGKMKGHLEEKNLVVISHNRRTGEKRTLGFSNFGEPTMIPSSSAQFAKKKY